MGGRRPRLPQTVGRRQTGTSAGHRDLDGPTGDWILCLNVSIRENVNGLMDKGAKDE